MHISNPSHADAGAAQDSPLMPSIAVVAIGRNEGERLRKCLESIQAIDYPADRIKKIYVDSGSTDGSVKLATSMGFNVLHLAGSPTAGRARNLGWISASEEFVLFLDGDTLLDPAFVQRALVEMREPRVAGVSGNRRESNAGSSIYNAILDLYWYAKAGPKAYFGGDALVRCEALRAVNGYRETLIAGEEPDMCRRMRGLGYVIYHIDVLMTLHDIDIHTAQQYWRRCIRSGYAYAEVSAIYADTDDPLWSRESRNNVIRGSFWAGFALLSVIAAIFSRRWLPVGFFVLILATLTLRTASSVRTREPRLAARLAFGLVSHLQHIPILLGQIRYWLARRSQRASGIIEYK